jgi:hypothetical protein
MPLPDLTAIETSLADATRDQLAALIGDLERLKAAAWARLLTPTDVSERHPSLPENGRYLTVREVCDQFKVSARWLYAHKQALPHSQPTRKVLLFPEEKIARWFAQRKRA